MMSSLLILHVDTTKMLSLFFLQQISVISQSTDSEALSFSHLECESFSIGACEVGTFFFTAF